MRAVGIFLVIGLVVWIVSAMVAPIGWHPRPEVIGLGSAFEGNLQLSSEKISAAFLAARERMLATNDWGSRLRLAGDVAGWLSFAATAAITLIAGFHGRMPAGTSASSSEGLPPASVRLIGFLAALAAILTAFSNLSISKSQDYFKRADDVQAIIMSSRAQIVDARTADSAQSIIDNMELRTKR